MISQFWFQFWWFPFKRSVQNWPKFRISIWIPFRVIFGTIFGNFVSKIGPELTINSSPILDYSFSDNFGCIFGNWLTHSQFLDLIFLAILPKISVQNWPQLRVQFSIIQFRFNFWQFCRQIRCWIDQIPSTVEWIGKIRSRSRPFLWLEVVKISINIAHGMW